MGIERFVEDEGTRLELSVDIHTHIYIEKHICTICIYLCVCIYDCVCMYMFNFVFLSAFSALIRRKI